MVSDDLYQFGPVSRGIGRFRCVPHVCSSPAQTGPPWGSGGNDFVSRRRRKREEVEGEGVMVESGGSRHGDRSDGEGVRVVGSDFGDDDEVVGGGGEVSEGGGEGSREMEEGDGDSSALFCPRP